MDTYEAPLWDSPKDLEALGSTNFPFRSSGSGATIRIHKGLSCLPRMAQKPRCGDPVPRVSARSGIRTVCRPLLLASVSAGGSSETGHRPRAQTSCSSVGRLGTDGKTAGIAEGKAGPLRENVLCPGHHLSPTVFQTTALDFSGFFPWSLTFHHCLSLLFFPCS